MEPQTSRPVFAADQNATRVLLIAGPTAAGKSAIALELATRLSGEIISADSMQVYRGMDIGTAKPGTEERQQIPHHLIDVADLTESFDAAQFIRMADEAIEGIRRRGNLPILCGGTGFYLKVWLDGLGEAPPANAILRAELAATPLKDLLRELERTDPGSFEKIDRQNPRRVIRAVEVIRVTGKPYSAQRSAWGEADSQSKRNAVCFGITWPSGELRDRINQRVDQMFQQGLIQETERLLARGLAANPTAMQALGYRQVVDYLNGIRPLAETIELVKIRTRQFAKRQMTWFKRHLRLHWISRHQDNDVASVTKQIVEDLSR
jgi:tRNA dimethylallyltransferase